MAKGVKFVVEYVSGREETTICKNKKHYEDVKRNLKAMKSLGVVEYFKEINPKQRNVKYHG